MTWVGISAASSSLANDDEDALTFGRAVGVRLSTHHRRDPSFPHVGCRSRVPVVRLGRHRFDPVRVSGMIPC